MKDKLDIKTLDFLAAQLGIPKSHLLKISNSSLEMYRTDEEPKKSGGLRILEKPQYPLKIIQRQINQILKKLELPDNIYSYVNDKSPLDNAQPHVGKGILLTLDIKSFFPSIKNKRVYNLFCSLGCAPDVARILTKLTTHNGHLPQGSPASPIIANHILVSIIKRFDPIEGGYHFTITYYGDDISISGNKRVKKFRNLLIKIIEQEGFKVAVDKCKIYGKDDQKEVTGVGVGKKGLFAIKKYVDEIKKQIDEGNYTEKKIRSIQGKIAWVNRINQKQGKHLNKYFEKAFY